MTAREQFIDVIRKALGRTETPARFTYRHCVHTDVMKESSRDELARAFIKYSKTIGSGVCLSSSVSPNR